MKKLILIFLLPVVGSFAQTADVKIDGQGNIINTPAINYATGKLKVNGVAVTTGNVSSVTGTAPIVSSGGTTPAISITAATTGAAGSMSAADKAKLDGIAAGAQPGTVTSVAVSVANGIGVTGSPITTSGTIALSLGALTPTSVASSGTVTGSNLSGTNTGDQTSIVGITGTLAQFNTALTGADFATGGGTATGTNTGDQDLSALALKSTTISTTSPLSGGGDLSANRTFAIADAAADGTTKGASTYTPADFNATTGLISLDYTNAQKANGSVPGFLTAADWTTFNGKESVLTFSTGLTRTTNTITVNTSQNIATLSNLTTNGFLKTSGGTGALSVDTTAYGTGSVTSFSAGDLSPLFTTTEATITTTPALSFALTNAAAHTVFGNFTGSSAAPSYNALGTGIDTALGVNIGSAGAPVLFNGVGGTPSSITLTNAGGTAASLTAGNVTTNANLTGHVTSTGNAAVLGSFTLAQLSAAVSDANIARIDAAQTFVGQQTFPTLQATSIGIGVAPTTCLLELNTSGSGSVNSARFLVPSLGSGSATDFYLGKAAGTYTSVAFGYNYSSTPANAYGYFTNYGDSTTAGLTVTSGGFTGIGGANTGTGTAYINGSLGIGVLSPSSFLQVVATSNQMRIGYDASNYFTGVVNSTGAVTLDAVGASAGFTFNDRIINTVPMRLKNYTVATLPAGTQGDTAFVTDALAPTFLATVVGGGAVVAPVFYNGTNWVGY